MRILTVYGTPHKGSTRAVTELFLKEFENDGNEFDEITLPKDLPDMCLGCANCILKGEDKCPHYIKAAPLIEKIKQADLLVLCTPVHVMSCTSALKTLLDHMAYMWLVHRPEETMFRKTAVIITTAGGSGIKDTIKLLKNNLFYLGVPYVTSYSITTMKMGGTFEEYAHKDKVRSQLAKKAEMVKKKAASPKVGIKTRFFYNIFKMTQKNGWNKTDSDYWKQKGWLDGKRPF